MQPKIHRNKIDQNITTISKSTFVVWMWWVVLEFFLCRQGGRGLASEFLPSLLLLTRHFFEPAHTRVTPQPRHRHHDVSVAVAYLSTLHTHTHTHQRQCSSHGKSAMQMDLYPQPYTYRQGPFPLPWQSARLKCPWSGVILHWLIHGGVYSRWFLALNTGLFLSLFFN